MSNHQEENNSTRREFIKKTSVLAAGSAMAGFSIVRNLGAAAGDPLRVGLVGCGGRGTGAADNILSGAANVHLVALADLYEDRLQKCLKNLNDPDREAGALKGVEVTGDRCFVGFDAYKQLLDCDLDLVLLATPPGFRPIHFASCVDAGKHVFAEKPVAVDATGVRQFIETGELARQKGLAVMAGTQRRHDPAFIECVKRVQDGQIGELMSVRCYYNTGFLWKYERQAGWSDMEWQTRNWYYFAWLSGDHIVEQHIHDLDNVNWVLDALPEKALGVGGRTVRTQELFGNIYDHFAIDYTYPGGLHVMSMSRQWGNTDRKVSVEVRGTKGTAIMEQDGRIFITGENAWRYRTRRIDSRKQEQTDLVAAIRSGQTVNDAHSIAQSTLTAIMGREAAYSGETVDWQRALESKQDLVPKKFKFGPLAIRPVPRPGEYRLR
ncbi:MAG: Gfo/Idh/MocA family oxidoreductase [Candidatus Glassbacteria bacterium]|nr:Gfo/Idh/MocA family oxidoreductase [Candidatus Glassbacteria bacterium]